MHVNVVNGFSDQPNGGNPAGVVLLGMEQSPQTQEITKEQMQEIATKLGYSETAFIKILGEGRFFIRYFTPAAEVPLCGHATIASFFYLYNRGIIGNGMYKLVTIETELAIEVTDGIIWMEMDAPSMEEELDATTVERICAAYGITTGDLDDRLKVRIVTSGLRDIHVCVKNREVLLGAIQDAEEVSRISKELDVVGVHMSCLKDASSMELVTAYCSNFAPYYDIPEECATGTSNGGLTYYLYRMGLVLPEKVNCFLQGEHMHRPSKVYTKVLLGEDVPQIWVGGQGVICEEDVNLSLKLS